MLVCGADHFLLTPESFYICGVQDLIGGCVLRRRHVRQLSTLELPKARKEVLLPFNMFAIPNVMGEHVAKGYDFVAIIDRNIGPQGPRAWIFISC